MPEAYSALLSDDASLRLPGGGESLEDVQVIIYDDGILGSLGAGAGSVIPRCGWSRIGCRMDSRPRGDAAALSGPLPTLFVSVSFRFQARVVHAAETIARRHAGGRVLIVSHGGVLNQLYCHASGSPYPGKIVNGSIHRFVVNGVTGDWTVTQSGDVNHLRGIGWISGTPDDNKTHYG